MRGFADALIVGSIVICLVVAISERFCRQGAPVEESVSGDILSVDADRAGNGETEFSITLDLDNGSVVVCPVQSDLYGGTLYRLYRNRKPDLPRLREAARVQVGRHSGSVVCRGLAHAED